MQTDQAGQAGHEPEHARDASLCAHLAHASNGWSAEAEVTRVGGGTVRVCRMCVLRADAGRAVVTINSATGVLWVDLSEPRVVDLTAGGTVRA